MRNGTVSSTPPSSIDLVTPKINQAYPQNSKTIHVRRTCPITKSATLMLLFAARHTARRRDDGVYPDAFVARAADSVRRYAHMTPCLLCRAREKASVRGGNMKERYICTLPNVVDEIDVLPLVLDGHDPAGANNQLAGEEVRRFEAEDKWLVFVPSIIDSVPRESA